MASPAKTFQISCAKPTQPRAAATTKARSMNMTSSYDSTAQMPERMTECAAPGKRKKKDGRQKEALSSQPKPFHRKGRRGRKGERGLPRINADERGSEKQNL